jgi:hypothetical protein
MTKRKTNAELAREVWDHAQPITGTLVDAYLQSRGITPPDPAPECLRFSPKLVHPNGQFFPAMIALPTNPKTGEPVGGIQRTFLAWTGKGKAQVEKNEQKMCPSALVGEASFASPTRLTANRCCWARVSRPS